MSAVPLSRRSLLLGAGSMAMAAGCSSGTSTASDTVRTALGPVRGNRRLTGFAFLNIPYAEPPVGALRFAAPVPPKSWTETKDCTKYGPTAQIEQLSAVTTIPEPSIPGAAYLNLNVFTPDPSSSAKLPVLVWIHGGGFIAGSPASPWYDGASFNRDGVVVVVLGYRLGIEGFLHVEGAPDNRAVLDWIAGLEWVRDNIAAFGGDPARVTIAGQSAGGGAVWALMGAPSARSLFRAGISESGALTQPNDAETAAAGAAAFTQATGVPATVAALRDLTREQLQQLQDKLPQPGVGANPSVLQLAPVADGTLIPESSAAMLNSGRSADVPLLIGFTRDEFNMIAAKVTDATAPTMLSAMGIDAATENAYRAAYPGLTTPQLVGQIGSDLVLRGPGYRVAEDHARRGRPTWLYEFTCGSTASGPYHGMAAHCLDIPYAFDLLSAPNVSTVEGDNPPQALATAMHKAWVEFITHGDPGSAWPRYTLDKRETMIWDDNSHVAQDPFMAQRPLWTH
ncbi:carboxylesterase family protein [Nocardia sp. NEAU-G5]|uniref:Carboxylic ester hydrolase n=1 Tax=Nocardia albiluteola TaxID=2842303 RepID=A0ABS6B875_9NOCA|nr:carboxylesterase family protein [Nocardia albiluteola]MBU3066515.1 carboxylesterase family protein [Nocardia albiluteola]